MIWNEISIMPGFDHAVTGSKGYTVCWSSAALYSLTDAENYAPASLKLYNRSDTLVILCFPLKQSFKPKIYQ